MSLEVITAGQDFRSTGWINIFLKDFDNWESKDPYPDPLYPIMNPKIRIRINVKMRWIQNPDEDTQLSLTVDKLLTSN